MAKAKKKAVPKKRADHYEPKVKTDLSFDDLIAMSVGKKPREKNTEKNDSMLEIPEEIQERYEALYNKVEDEMKDKQIAKSLLELCSVFLDRNGNNNQVNLEFLLNSSFEARRELKKSFDKNSVEYSFTMNYTNLVGNL